MENQQNIHRGVSLQQKSIISTMYDGYEVHPCREIELPNGAEIERAIMACEPNEAEFWSVYGHLKEGGCECVADCLTEDIANKFAKWCEDTLSVLLQIERINNSDELVASMEKINTKG